MKIGLSVASPRFVLVAVLVPLIVSGTGAQQIAGAPITIAWDANQERVAGYRVHVGTRTGTYTESFDVGRETRFTYDATQPGLRYYFAVSAYLDTGVSSDRSSEISTVAVAALPAATSSAPPQSTAGVSADRTSTTTQAVEASSEDLRVRARGLDSVTSLSATSDGTLFLVEREQRVGVIPPEASVAVMSLAASAGTRITGVVPDPLFTSTRFVYVGLVQDAPIQGFSVVRYRLVRNALGEPAVVISGLPTFGRSPRLTIDRSGKIYVAIPGARESTSDPYAGMILRFNADGTVPQGSRAASPQLAHGADDPAALTADGSYLWFVGHQSAERDRLGRLSLNTATSDAWPVIPESVDLGNAASDWRVLAMRTVRADGVEDHEVLASRDDQSDLQIVSVAGRVQRRLELPGADASAIPEAAAFGSGREVYLALRSADGTSSIVELRSDR